MADGGMGKRAEAGSVASTAHKPPPLETKPGTAPNETERETEGQEAMDTSKSLTWAQRTENISDDELPAAQRVPQHSPNL